LVSSPIGSADGLKNIVTTNARSTYDVAVVAVAYGWIVIGNAVLMRRALTIVGLFDACATALVMSVQMAKVEIRNAI
jgi:hypothetical protein